MKVIPYNQIRFLNLDCKIHLMS